MNLRLDYVELGIERHTSELNRRLEGMNEFRNAFKDQNHNFTTRVEFDAKLLLVDSKIEGLQKLVYIGIGILIVVQIMIGFVKFSP